VEHQRREVRARYVNDKKQTQRLRHEWGTKKRKWMTSHADKRAVDDDDDDDDDVIITGAQSAVGHGS